MLTTETVRLPTGRVWQVQSGGSGPTLVWLHGIRGVDPADPVLSALAARHHVMAPVAPGFNDLDEFEEIADVHDLALDYDDLFEALKLDRVSLIGHSIGAMAAAELAAHLPHRVQKLVLIAPLGLWNDAYPVPDFFALTPSEMEQMLWHDNAAREAHATRLSNEGKPPDAGEAMVTNARNLTAVAKFVWPLPDKGLRKRLHRIAAPVLVIFGAEDRYVSPRYAEDFGRRLRQSRAEIVPGAGHMAPYEQRERVVELIEDFMQDAARH